MVVDQGNVPNRDKISELGFVKVNERAPENVLPRGRRPRREVCGLRNLASIFEIDRRVPAAVEIDRFSCSQGKRFAHLARSPL